MKKVNEGEFLHPCRSLLELNKKKTDPDKGGLD